MHYQSFPKFILSATKLTTHLTIQLRSSSPAEENILGEEDFG
jgi:hypothetical protein